MKQNKLSEKWIKASIVGTLWAASEIVIGSFLHNLRIPFSGNVLTAIALIILISISYVWNDKGLFWRAGIICALMKTLSPSAVIFGPMIAIVSEAFLLEFSVRLFGRNVAGFLIGSMLAMSWNLFQKIINYIIFYGADIIKIYNDLTIYALKQFNLDIDGVWLPIAILVLIYFLFGSAAGIIGIKVGRKLVHYPRRDIHNKNEGKQVEFFNSKKEPAEFDYSLTWLAINVSLIILAFFVLQNALFSGIIFISIVIVMWAFKYKRAIRHLSKPRFWISFVLITMLVTLTFTQLPGNEMSVNEALFIGLKMNFRAAIIIVGFSVLGTELYNPKIRDYFSKTYFKNIPLALELSFESLPLIISSIPEFKKIIRQPVSVFHTTLSQLEFRLDQLKKELHSQVIVITGDIADGKTRFIEYFIQKLHENNISVSGVYSPRIMEHEKTIGYDIVDIVSGKCEKFLRLANGHAQNTIGKYEIFESGLLFGKNALQQGIANKTKVIIIDEVGKLELMNKGWADEISEILSHYGIILMITARSIFMEEIQKKWQFDPMQVMEVSTTEFSDMRDQLINRMLS